MLICNCCFIRYGLVPVVRRLRVYVSFRVARALFDPGTRPTPKHWKRLIELSNT